VFVASTAALKVCLHYPYCSVSNDDLHKLTNRATPSLVCDYKMAFLLDRTFTDKLPEDEWLHLNENFINTSRHTLFKVKRAHNCKIALNCATNRLHLLNDKIPMNWFNKGYNNYKIGCKKLFFSF
jgi:hypothetical protein